jgi:S-disulfanyl-L-cysteine oxidoreductase SoxD
MACGAFYARANAGITEKHSTMFDRGTRILMRVLMGGLLAAMPPMASAENTPAFTAEQARRGQKIFNNHCSACHAVDVPLSASHPLALAGDTFLQRWHNMSDLYGKITMTMPADKVFSLDEQQNLDVIAWLLQRNGFAAGTTALNADRESMRSMLIAARVPSAKESTQSENGLGYYSAQQAARGKGFFDGSCANCHVAEAKQPAGKPTGDPLLDYVSLVDSGGVAVGSFRIKNHLAGEGFLQRWPSVGAFFKRIRTTMPQHEPDALDAQTYLDITAYLLQANGLASGPEDLPNDDERLDAMLLPEPGFQPLFNGHDFTGLSFVIGNSCAPQPQGCGSTRPAPTFAIEKGSIQCTGYPPGYMYTDKQYFNFTLRFEYRLTPSAHAGPDDIYWGNSGYLFFITENKVWPKSLEIEGLEVIALRPLGLDTAPTYRYDEHALRQAQRPPGRWNQVEIVSQGGEMRASLNGVLLAVVSKHEFTQPGHIGFQSEDARIAWRNLRIREE